MKPNPTSPFITPSHQNPNLMWWCDPDSSHHHTNPLKGVVCGGVVDGGVKIAPKDAEEPQPPPRPPKPIRRRLDTLRERAAFLAERAVKREAIGQPSNRDRAEEAALRWALRLIESTLEGRGLIVERNEND